MITPFSGKHAEFLISGINMEIRKLGSTFWISLSVIYSWSRFKFNFELGKRNFQYIWCACLCRSEIINRNLAKQDHRTSVQWKVKEFAKKYRKNKTNCVTLEIVHAKLQSISELPIWVKTRCRFQKLELSTFVWSSLETRYNQLMGVGRSM